MFGDYQPQNPYELQKLGKEILKEKNSEWTQVGMNPYRGSYFYDKVTGRGTYERADIFYTTYGILFMIVYEFIKTLL